MGGVKLSVLEFNAAPLSRAAHARALLFAAKLQGTFAWCQSECAGRWGDTPKFAQGLEDRFFKRHRLRQIGTRGGFGLREETGGVLLYQSVRSGLFRAVALAVDRGDIRRPLGVAGRWLAHEAPEVVTSAGLNPSVAIQTPCVQPTRAYPLLREHLCVPARSRRWRRAASWHLHRTHEVGRPERSHASVDRKETLPQPEPPRTNAAASASVRSPSRSARSARRSFAGVRPANLRTARVAWA